MNYRHKLMTAAPGRDGKDVVGFDIVGIDPDGQPETDQTRIDRPYEQEEAMHRPAGLPDDGRPG